MAIDGVPCDDLAKRFDTPLYVLSEDRIRHNYRAFREAPGIYPDVLVCPAHKANSYREYVGSTKWRAGEERLLPFQNSEWRLFS